ncbi:MAG: glycosyltransferase family 4 protein [Muribaculaceae bacterium]
MKNNTILIDFKLKPGWTMPDVLASATHEPWIVEQRQTNQFHGGKLATLKRMLWYFVFPLQVVMRRKQYKRIIAWQQFFGLNFAFWCRLLHLRKVNDVTVLTFIYKRKPGLAGAAYHKYMSYIVNSKYIDRFVCYSREECDYYAQAFGTGRERFVYMPLGLAPIEHADCTDEGYVFATGRSNRDYDFLARVVQGTTYKCVIACDGYTKTIEADNVTVLDDCFGERMIDVMAHCRCVAIPLKDATISSGQLVILQAMSLGKPVICSDVAGIRDYVEAGSAVMLPNDVDKWREALHGIFTDDGFAAGLTQSSQALFQSRFTENALFERIARAIMQ